jgi:hypothetical protein
MTGIRSIRTLRGRVPFCHLVITTYDRLLTLKGHFIFLAIRHNECEAEEDR